MKKYLFGAEKAVFYLLVFFCFAQIRLTLRSFQGQFNEWTSAFFYATDILVFVLILFWTGRTIKNFGNFKFFIKKYEIALFVFLGLSAVSVSLLNNYILGFYSWLKILEFSFLFFYASRNFAKLFDLEKFWKIFAAGVSISSLAAIYQFLAQKSLGLRYFESPLSPAIAGVAKIDVAGQKIIRAYGFLPHPNILAAFLILAIFGLIYLYLKNKPAKLWQKIIYLAGFCLFLTALFFTFSRVVTAIGFAFLAFWLAWLFWRRKELRRSLVGIFCLIFTVFSLLSIIYWPYFSVRYDPLNLGGSQAVNLRLYYNQQAIEMVKIAPILGVGQGNFVTLISSKQFLPGWMYQPAHNIYLLMAAETGLLGLLAFLAFLFFTIRSAWSRRRDLSAACHLSLVACLIVFGLFDHFLWDLQQGQLIFFLFLGILASMSAHSSTRPDTL